MKPTMILIFLFLLLSLVPSVRAQDSGASSDEVVIDDVEFLRLPADGTGIVRPLATPLEAAPQMEKLAEVVPGEEVHFKFRTNLRPEQVSLLVSQVNAHGENKSALFVPYFDEEDAGCHRLFYGLGKYDKGDNVTIVIMRTGDRSDIVYRTGFRIPTESWYTLRTGMVRLNTTSDFRVTFMVKTLFPPRRIDVDVPYVPEFANWTWRRMSPMFGVTLSQSLVTSVIEKEMVYLFGVSYELNRYVDVDVGWCFTDLSADNDQLWYGVTVDTDLFGFLAGKVAGRE